jgi:hypothetical protein
VESDLARQYPLRVGYSECGCSVKRSALEDALRLPYNDFSSSISLTILGSQGKTVFHRERGRPTFNGIGKPPFFAGKQWLTYEKIKAEAVILSTEKLLL